MPGIAAEYKVRRSKPRNLQADDLWKFEHEFDRSFPISEKLSVKWITLDSEGVFISYKRVSEIITQRSVLYKLNFISYLRFLLSRFFNGKLVFFRSTCFWITDSWSNGYFHWMLDSLPRILKLINGGEKSILLVLPHQFRQISFVESSLNTLGINRIKYIPENGVGLFRQIILQSHLAPTGNYSEEIIRKLRNEIINSIGFDNVGKLDRIYISRDKAARRKVLNESDLLKSLNKYGFQIVYLEDYIWLDQVKLCMGASAMVGLHGAGLSNMLFLKPEAKIVELRGEMDGHNNCYFSLASALDLPYYYLNCASTDNNTLNSDFIVPIKKFEMLLSDIFV